GTGGFSFGTDSRTSTTETDSAPSGNIGGFSFVSAHAPALPNGSGTTKAPARPSMFGNASQSLHAPASVFGPSTSSTFLGSSLHTPPSPPGPTTCSSVPALLVRPPGPHRSNSDSDEGCGQVTDTTGPLDMASTPHSVGTPLSLASPLAINGPAPSSMGVTPTTSRIAASPFKVAEASGASTGRGLWTGGSFENFKPATASSVFPFFPTQSPRASPPPAKHLEKEEKKSPVIENGKDSVETLSSNASTSPSSSTCPAAPSSSFTSSPGAVEPSMSVKDLVASLDGSMNRHRTDLDG
ncbi:hypothetical protein Naga_100706g2, partial [Nannochloropsis gaditana]